MNDFSGSNDYLNTYLDAITERADAADRGENEMSDEERRLTFDQVLGRFQANAKTDLKGESPLMVKFVITLQALGPSMDNSFSLENKKRYLKMLSNANNFFKQSDINAYARDQVGHMNDMLGLDVYLREAFLKPA